MGYPIQNEKPSHQSPIEAMSMPMRFPFPLRRHTIRATLYSKAGCHLCQEAEAVVRRVFGARHVDVVDIIGDRRLEDEFIFRIPVLVVDGQVLAEGQITMADARLARQAAVTRQRCGERA